MVPGKGILYRPTEAFHMQTVIVSFVLNAVKEIGNVPETVFGEDSQTFPGQSSFEGYMECGGGVGRVSFPGHSKCYMLSYDSCFAFRSPLKSVTKGPKHNSYA